MHYLQTFLANLGRISPTIFISVPSLWTKLQYGVACRIADDFLKTDNLGEINSEGYLKLTGRIKVIFKTSKGKYITPAPVQLRLAENLLIEIARIGGSVLSQPIAMIMPPNQAQRSWP